MALTGPNVNISSTAQTVTGGDSGAVVIGSLTAPKLSLNGSGTQLILNYATYAETDVTSAAGRGTKFRLRPATLTQTNATAFQVHNTNDTLNSGFGYFQADEFGNVGVGVGKNGTATMPMLYLTVNGVNAIACHATGSVVVGNYAPIATNATTGFLYIPRCAGIPTGTPELLGSGSLPLVIDSTNNKMYFYSGGAWNALN